LFNQGWNIAGVIAVGVGENQRIKFGWLKRELAVSLKRLFTAALVPAAIQQNCLAIDGKQVYRAGNGLGRTPKL
jgi:hypothetical protein